MVHSAASSQKSSLAGASGPFGARSAADTNCAGSSPTEVRSSSRRRTLDFAAGQDRQHIGHSVKIQPDDNRAVRLADEEAAAVRRQAADELEFLRAKAEAFAIMLFARLRVGHEDRGRGLFDDR